MSTVDKDSPSHSADADESLESVAHQSVTSPSANSSEHLDLDATSNDKPSDSSESSDAEPQANTSTSDDGDHSDADNDTPQPASSTSDALELTAGPVDPGLAMVARSTTSRGSDPLKNGRSQDGKPRPKKQGAAKKSGNRPARAADGSPVRPRPEPAVTADTGHDLENTAEQLVIKPVSDLVGAPTERPARRPKRSANPTERPARTATTTETDEYRTAPIPRIGGAPSTRGSNRRARVRRVTRVVRHIDPWSAFKAGLLFNLVGYLVCLTSGVLLWRVAEQTGTIDNMQGWFTQFGWETFELDGGEIFHNAWIIGLFLAVGFTGLLVLAVTVFNLVSDIIGGVRISVLEEEVVERRVTTSRRYALRRPGVGAKDAVGGTADWATEGEVTRPQRSAPKPLPSTTTDWSVDD